MGSRILLSRWLADNYVSRRGFIRTNGHRLLNLFGWYHKYHRIDFGSVDRLVFVCKGNICRSAFAEVVARSLGMEAISCGLKTVVAATANVGAINTARALGYDLQAHRTRPIMYVVFRKTDLIVVMEPWHADFIDLYLTRKHYLTLLGLWHKPAHPHIQDPYGASSAYFKKCFNKIEKSVYGIAAEIKRSGR